MVKVYAKNGSTSYNICSYVLNNAKELSLCDPRAKDGSIAFVVDTADLYMKKDNNWTSLGDLDFPSQVGGDSFDVNDATLQIAEDGSLIVNGTNTGINVITKDLSIEPDWTENDENSPNYIKNRTHYKEENVKVLEEIGYANFITTETINEDAKNEGIPYPIESKVSLYLLDNPTTNILIQQPYNELIEKITSGEISENEINENHNKIAEILFNIINKHTIYLNDIKYSPMPISIVADDLPLIYGIPEGEYFGPMLIMAAENNQFMGELIVYGENSSNIKISLENVGNITHYIDEYISEDFKNKVISFSEEYIHTPNLLNEENLELTKINEEPISVFNQNKYIYSLDISNKISSKFFSTLNKINREIKGYNEDSYLNKVYSSWIGLLIPKIKKIGFQVFYCDMTIDGAESKHAEYNEASQPKNSRNYPSSSNSNFNAFIKDYSIRNISQNSTNENNLFYDDFENAYNGGTWNIFNLLDVHSGGEFNFNFYIPLDEENSYALIGSTSQNECYLIAMTTQAEKESIIIEKISIGVWENEIKNPIGNQQLFTRNGCEMDNTSLAIGFNSIASGLNSFSEGYQTIASGQYSHAEGNQTKTFIKNSHAEGYQTKTKADSSHAEGNQTTTLGQYSHAEGKQTIASGQNSHAEGSATFSQGKNSHAEGKQTIASGHTSHAEGRGQPETISATEEEIKQFIQITNGLQYYNKSINFNDLQIILNEQVYEKSNAWNKLINTYWLVGYRASNSINICGFVKFSKDNNTYQYSTYSDDYDTLYLNNSYYLIPPIENTVGSYSHTEGFGTVAQSDYSHAAGKFNKIDGTMAYQIGNGTNIENRADAFNVRWDGVAQAFGTPDTEYALVPRWAIENLISRLNLLETNAGLTQTTARYIFTKQST